MSEAPALTLMNITRPFSICVYEKGEVELEVLTEQLGHRIGGGIAMDPVVSGWPPCLQALAAMVALVQEADKLTLGQKHH